MVGLVGLAGWALGRMRTSAAGSCSCRKEQLGECSTSARGARHHDSRYNTIPWHSSPSSRLLPSPSPATPPCAALAASSLQPHHRYRSLSRARLNYVWRSTFPCPRHLPSADNHCPIGSASGDLVSQPSIPARGQVPPPAYHFYTFCNPLSLSSAHPDPDPSLQHPAAAAARPCFCVFGPSPAPDSPPRSASNPA